MAAGRPADNGSAVDRRGVRLHDLRFRGNVLFLPYPNQHN